jgi:hypothetical protein
MAFPPMGIGLEVDMETGEPVVLEQLARHAQREEAKARRQERQQRLLDDLSGQGGEVCKLAAEQLAQRIDELVAADPAAGALLALLQRVSGIGAVGLRIAQDRLTEATQQEA